MKTLPAFILLTLLSCSAIHKTSNTMQFDLEGHRGCRGLRPENTIAAMLHAIDLGVNTLEMDVVITKDKQVILSHEPFFNYEITTKSNGSFVSESEEKALNMYKMDYAEVLKYDVGLKPHPRFPQQLKMAAVKPKLSAVIDSVESYCKSRNIKPPHYNIEIKSLPKTDNIFHPEVPEFVQLVVQVVELSGVEPRTILQSFDTRPLQHLHEKYKQITTSLLIEGDDKKSFDEQISALGFKPAIYSPEFSLVTPQLVKECHNAGMKIVPWTVNSAGEIQRLKAMGVDGIITDYPNLKF